MGINLGYKANFILESKSDSRFIIESCDGTFLDIDRHLENFRELRKQKAIAWMKKELSISHFRLNKIFFEDAHLFKSCVVEVTDIWIEEDGTFFNKIEFGI